MQREECRVWCMGERREARCQVVWLCLKNSRLRQQLLETKIGDARKVTLAATLSQLFWRHCQRRSNDICEQRWIDERRCCRSTWWHWFHAYLSLPKPVHHSNLVDDEVEFIALTCERRAEVQALHKHLTTIIWTVPSVSSYPNASHICYTYYWQPEILRHTS